jgi:hypothetical protein
VFGAGSVLGLKEFYPQNRKEFTVGGAAYLELVTYEYRNSMARGIIHHAEN